MEKWTQLGIKDQIQYIIAIVLFLSGISIAFISFFLTFNIASGTLIYIAQAFITGGGIFGVSIYFRTKLGEFQSKAMINIEELIRKIVRDCKDNDL